MLRFVALTSLFIAGSCDQPVSRSCHKIDEKGSPIDGVQEHEAPEAKAIKPEANAISTILAGLKSHTPRIPFSFLYDERGSELYEEILQQAEYYLPSAEVSLLREHVASIASLNKEPCHTEDCRPESQVVVELGSGAGHKTLPLLDHMAKEASHTTYVPVDISNWALVQNQEYFKGHFEARQNVSIHPLWGRVEDCIPALSLSGFRTYLYMGSNLGNLNDTEATDLLDLVASKMSAQDRFLLALDREHGPTKPQARIEAAYNDAAGVTAAFTVNALAHVNRVAKFDFSTNGWKHVAEYDPARSSIVTHVEAVSEQKVCDPAGRVVRTFKSGDRIFMEQSRKFSVDGVSQLAHNAGLVLSRKWLNDDYLIVEMRRDQTARLYADMQVV